MTTLDHLTAALQDIDSSSFANEADRSRAEDIITKALARVRTPWGFVFHHNWVNPTTNASIKTLIDAGVFKKWAEAGGGPKTSIELSRLTNTDPKLIKRLVRHLATQHLLIEVAEDTYEPTDWAKALGTDPSFPAPYGTFYHDLMSDLFRAMPSFLKKTGYKNPTDVENGIVQYLHGPDVSFFSYIVSDPVRNKEFAETMECTSKGSFVAWPDVFPTDTLLEGAKSDRPIVVDVGGSKGYDLEKFRLKHPDIPDGSLVLQDLPGVVQDVEINEKAISKLPYDFFTPQPLKGARAYYLHSVLHDWPDEPAVKILKNVAGAMEKGYSKLLVHESMIESIKPSLHTTTSDLSMLACVSAADRTVSEWYALLATAGLKVVKIWKKPGGVDGVIEAELV